MEKLRRERVGGSGVVLSKTFPHVGLLRAKQVELFRVEAGGFALEGGEEGRWLHERREDINKMGSWAPGLTMRSTVCTMARMRRTEYSIPVCIV